MRLGDVGPPSMRAVRFQHQVEDSTTALPNLKPLSPMHPLFNPKPNLVYFVGIGGRGMTLPSLFSEFDLHAISPFFPGEAATGKPQNKQIEEED